VHGTALPGNRVEVRATVFFGFFASTMAKNHVPTMIAASNLVVKATRNYETIASDPAYRTKKKLPELTYF
jgi:hypothetical protein